MNDKVSIVTSRPRRSASWRWRWSTAAVVTVGRAPCRRSAVRRWPAGSSSSCRCCRWSRKSATWRGRAADTATTASRGRWRRGRSTGWRSCWGSPAARWSPSASLRSQFHILCLSMSMSQNYYQEVSNYFGINTVKELIHNRFQKFRISYGAADNYLYRLIFAKCWTYFDCTVHIFGVFSWLPFFDCEIKLYIYSSVSLSFTAFVANKLYMHDYLDR